MWIAKPVNSLSLAEKRAWAKIEEKAPLSQTLVWARAIESVSGSPFAVFCPEEAVGGLVFSTAKNHKGSFECINGPTLDWDQPKSIARQFATFAMATSKLDPHFRRLTIKPRWEKETTERRLSLLPIQSSQRDHAATLIIPIQTSIEAQFDGLTSRMKRTLRHTLKSNLHVSWEPATPHLMVSFVSKMTDFGKKRDFTVPPIQWFQTLTENLEKDVLKKPQFWLATATLETEKCLNSIAQLLICIHNQTAIYLFGYENRVPQLRSSMSCSAAAHWEVLQKCVDQKLRTYDLNGYLVNAESHHPYYGVCQFKDQFAGRLVEYEHPEFVIE